MDHEPYRWCRFPGNRPAYEVSGHGDRQYSAFGAVLSDGRSIEEHYQCDVKGYDPGGRNWRLGKGRPPKYNMTVYQQWQAYLDLWRRYFKENPEALTTLRLRLRDCKLLSDKFATSEINQAKALATLLNEEYVRC
jgi:hypothetical protein